MALKWDDYAEIAEALHARYPDADLVAMDEKELFDKASRLENFADSPAPDNSNVYMAIMTVWTELAAGEEYDGSLFDAHV